MNDKYKSSLLKKAKKGVVASSSKEEFVKFDDIKDSLTGYGRMISYKSNNSNPDPAFNNIDSVVEGQFQKGLKHGYCRGISAIDGSCAAGFHKEGIPNGKWTFYKPDGHFGKPEGLYEGSTCTQQIAIHNFQTGILKAQ